MQLTEHAITLRRKQRCATDSPEEATYEQREQFPTGLRDIYVLAGIFDAVSTITVPEGAIAARQSA
jgi:hypothetical protein